MTHMTHMTHILIPYHHIRSLTFTVRGENWCQIFENMEPVQPEKKRKCVLGPCPPNTPPPWDLWAKCHLPAPPDWREKYMKLMQSSKTGEQRRSNYTMFVFYLLTQDLDEDPQCIYEHFHELHELSMRELQQMALLDVIALGARARAKLRAFGVDEN